MNNTIRESFEKIFSNVFPEHDKPTMYTKEAMYDFYEEVVNSQSQEPVYQVNLTEEKLREALESLWDVQNGSPLPKYDNDYAIARALTIEALTNKDE